MLHRTLALTLLLLSVVFVAGCGPDCRLMCEERENADCEGDNDVPDCESECKHYQDLVTNAECQDEWDLYLICLDDLEEICDVVPEPCVSGERCKDPKCDNELDDLGDCFSDYCAKHPKNNECESLFGGTPTGA
jgi:hypothetical protein